MINSRCTSSPSLSIGRVESTTARGKGWRGGKAVGLCELVLMVKVAGVMVGLMKYVFISKNSVTLSGVAFNPSWHLTRRGRRGCKRCVLYAGSLSLGR
jgi:hypothetical protein